MRPLPYLALLLLVAPVASAQDYAGWPDGATNPYGRVPIRVFIDAANLTSQTMRYVDEVRGAWTWWAEGGNGRLAWGASFVDATDRASADILVWFVEADHVLCGNGEPGAGCGSFGGAKYGTPGVVFLATLEGYVPPSTKTESSQRMPDVRQGSRQHRPFDAVRRTAEHELGHALGFKHSDDPQDIMHPSWDGFATSGDRPESILSRAQAMRALGWGAGSLAAAGLGMFVYHHVLDARDRRRIRRLDFKGPHGTPLPPESPPRPAPVVKGGSAYVRNPPCPGTANGEHAFELQLSNGETWFVCRSCRYPKRL